MSNEALGAASGRDEPPVELVLFDLDGTLVDTIALILASFRHAMNEVVGEVPPDDVLLRHVGVPLRVQMQEFAPDRVEEVLTSYRAYNARVHDEMIAEYQGTEDALAELRDAGLKLGVVTSKSREPARRSLAAFGLDRFMDVLVTSDDTEIHKPDPTPLLLAAQQAGVPAGRCAYVGDSPHDMTAALGAGMVPVAALWGPFPERVLEPGPAFAAPTIAAVPRIVAGEGDRFAVGPHCR
jgi:pyrophosphatase PpaX